MRRAPRRGRNVPPTRRWRRAARARPTRTGHPWCRRRTFGRWLPTAGRAHRRVRRRDPPCDRRRSARTNSPECERIPPCPRRARGQGTAASRYAPPRGRRSRYRSRIPGTRHRTSTGRPGPAPPRDDLRPRCRPPRWFRRSRAPSLADRRAARTASRERRSPNGGCRPPRPSTADRWARARGSGPRAAPACRARSIAMRACSDSSPRRSARRRT